jgi:phosphoribosylformimino-5-aminoimidazole carboxamide ribotide isomerase
VARVNFIVYPAIDVRGGRVVRLRQGDYADETRYAADPLALARAHAAAGADWLHLVDLDGAREGGYALQALLRDIRDATTLRLQTGGGVRCADDVQRLLDAGAERVVVGSLAVREPARVVGWLARFGPQRITLALDARGRDGAWQVASHGWTQAGPALEPLAERFAAAGLVHLLCTDIDRDGMLAGPNVTLYRALRARLPGVAVQASGGVRNADDCAALRAAGCAGVVLGKALLEGRVALQEALSC